MAPSAMTNDAPPATATLLELIKCTGRVAGRAWRDGGWDASISREDVEQEAALTVITIDRQGVLDRMENPVAYCRVAVKRALIGLRRRKRTLKASARLVSLDDGEAPEMADVYLTDNGNASQEIERRILIDELLRGAVDAQARRVMRLILRGLRQADVARILGLSKMRVCQIVNDMNTERRAVRRFAKLGYETRNREAILARHRDRHRREREARAARRRGESPSLGERDRLARNALNGGGFE